MRRIFQGIAVAGLLWGAVVASAPALSASALTIADIQSQIQSLLARVAELTNQLNVLRAQGQADVSTAEQVRTPAPFKHRICSALYRNLALGAEGDDVVSLQEFLRDNGYLSANATGYFGSLTSQAVAKWQSSEDVLAVGILGPISRERIKAWCSRGWTPRERFRVSPTRGDAPLMVTFSTWLSAFRVNTISYTIDFGDGSSEHAADCYAPADACQSPGQNTHTYSANGTYIATLNKITNTCPPGAMCFVGPMTEVVGRTQIYVGPTACTKEYKPVCGSKPIICITTPCNPVPTTYGNRCEMNADGASLLYEGVCRDGGDQPPVISGFSGPTTLAVNQSGTWSISASDPENQTLSYQVTWGDEYVPYAMNSAMTASAPAFVQTTTFTHSYAAAGTYTITIVVRDTSGQSAKTSSTVQVTGSISCTQEYAPVCGQPPEPACRHSTPACMIATPGPQTYSNICYLNAAGAALLYSGQCQNTVVCTQEAMQCPDGSYVGRTGPNCQFVCPTTTGASCTTSDGVTVNNGLSLVFYDQGTGGHAMSFYVKCSNGLWLSMGVTPTSAPSSTSGFVATYPPISTTGASCTWTNGQTVANGSKGTTCQLFGGDFCRSQALVAVQWQCNSGSWYSCDYQGNNCQAY